LKKRVQQLLNKNREVKELLRAKKTKVPPGISNEGAHPTLHTAEYPAI